MYNLYQEPKHNFGPITTANSTAEGRMKESFLPREKRRKAILDGVGGCKTDGKGGCGAKKK